MNRMRLIDADKINFEEVFGGQSDFAKDLRKAAQEFIGSQPTAFDKEKVIGEIQNQHELSDTCAYESDYPTEVSYYKGRALGHEIDIEIVEKGGIE